MSATSHEARGSASAGPPAGFVRFGSRLLTSGVVLGGLGVALAMLPGGYNPFGPAKALVLTLAAAAVAAGLALDPGLLRAAWTAARRQPAAWAAAALLLVGALATLTSVDPSQSLVGHYPEYEGLLLLLLSAVIGLGACVLAASGRGWVPLGRAAVLVVLGVSAYALLQYAGLDPVPSLLTFVARRVRSTLGNASNLGIFLVLALPLVVARARAEAGAWRTVSWCAAGVGVVVLAWSLSRGAWVGALVAALAWLLVEGRRWSARTRAKVGGIAAGALVASVVAVALLVPSASARLAGLADPSSGTPAWRLEVWGLTARLALDRPALGWGPGSFRYVFPGYRTASTIVGESGEQVLGDPHNVLASAAAAGGVPALLAFVTLAVGSIAAAWRLDADGAWPLAGPALAAALAGGLAALQFHFFTLDSAPLFAMLAGVAVGRAGVTGATGAAGARGAALTTGATGKPVPARAGATTLAPDASSPRTRTTLRIAAAALSALCVLLLLAAAGLVAADRALAEGWALVDAQAPWSEARADFSRAVALAPWEPAMPWALGRGATRWMSRAGDTSAFPDAEAALLSAARRLPADPLLAAQTAEAYLVAGLASRDAALVESARARAERAVALDPQNGYRWDTLGTARAALGDTAGARQALERAVQYAPGDRQAWLNLARMCERAGENGKAAGAAARAAAIPETGPATATNP